MSLQHSEEDKNSPRKKISNIDSEAFKLSLRAWQQERDNTVLDAHLAQAVGLQSASNCDPRLKNAALSDDGNARTLAIMADLFAAQLASSDFRIKSLTTQLEGILTLAQSYCSDLTACRNKLEEKENLIKVLQKHIDEYDALLEIKGNPGYQELYGL